jgi:4-carboxymuconolactone decarboxylase
MTAPRITPAPPAESEPGRAAEAQILSSRGSISQLYRLLLHSPPVAMGWESLLTAIRSKTRIAPVLREMVILRVAVLNGAPYEFEAHTPFALAAGLTKGRIQALQSDAREQFDPRECCVLDYCDAMTGQVHVPDQLFARVREYFDEAAMVELTATIAAYNMVSRFLEALHVR